MNTIRNKGYKQYWKISLWIIKNKQYLDLRLSFFPLGGCWTKFCIRVPSKNKKIYITITQPNTFGDKWVSCSTHLPFTNFFVVHSHDLTEKTVWYSLFSREVSDSQQKCVEGTDVYICPTPHTYLHSFSHYQPPHLL